MNPYFGACESQCTSWTSGWFVLKRTLLFLQRRDRRQGWKSPTSLFSCLFLQTECKGSRWGVQEERQGPSWVWQEIEPVMGVLLWSSFVGTGTLDVGFYAAPVSPGCPVEPAWRFGCLDLLFLQVNADRVEEQEICTKAVIFAVISTSLSSSLLRDFLDPSLEAHYEHS